MYVYLTYTSWAAVRLTDVFICLDATTVSLSGGSMFSSVPRDVQVCNPEPAFTTLCSLSVYGLLHAEAEGNRR